VYGRVALLLQLININLPTVLRLPLDAFTIKQSGPIGHDDCATYTEYQDDGNHLICSGTDFLG
jgi:hypothetical protein